MEGRGGDFEENADHHEGEGGENETMGARVGYQAGDFVDLGRAGGAEDEGYSVEQEAGGEGAEEKVLDGGFRAFAGVFAESGEDVGGDGGDFKGDEDDQEFNGGGHQAHTDGAENHEGEVFAAMMLVGGQGV